MGKPEADALNRGGGEERHRLWVAGEGEHHLQVASNATLLLPGRPWRRGENVFFFACLLKTGREESRGEKQKLQHRSPGDTFDATATEKQAFKDFLFQPINALSQQGPHGFSSIPGT